MRAFKALLLSLFLTVPAYADVISVADFSADSGVSHLNNFKNTTVNVINGNIQGSTDGGLSKANIDEDTVHELNMADNANPRVRDAELLSVGVDSLSGSTLNQETFVYSGCVPADDTDLTSDISACVVYINGHRVSVGATSTTYIANMDHYVDISQNGTYNVSPVALGASQPSVAANSARVSKVVTNGTEISSVTDLARRRLSGLVVPANYRNGLYVSKDSATVFSILPGTVEINNAMVTKSGTSTLTISTSGDYAGGSALNAADTFVFVGMDADGNLKLHTTAPSHDNYAVSSTAGKKRYATWSSTVYRILGWGYLGTSTNLDLAGNLKEGDVSNAVVSNDTSTMTTSSTSFVATNSIPFYSSGGRVILTSTMSGDAAGSGSFIMDFTENGTQIAGSGAPGAAHGAAAGTHITSTFMPTLPVSQASRKYGTEFKTDSTSISLRRRSLIVEEL